MRHILRLFARLSAVVGSLLSLPAWADFPAPGMWEAEIARFEAADKIAPPKPGSILFVGSSSIRKWTTLGEDFPNRSVLNRGFGGSHIADSTYFAGRIIVPYRPGMIVLYAGDNDLAEGHNAKQVCDDFIAFVARIRRDLPTVKIAFVSIKPSPSRAHLLPAMREANAAIEGYIHGHPNLLYIDVFSRMLDANGQPRTELFGEDRLHMNRQGYALWQSLIAPYLP